MHLHWAGLLQVLCSDSQQTKYAARYYKIGQNLAVKSWKEKTSIVILICRDQYNTLVFHTKASAFIALPH